MTAPFAWREELSLGLSRAFCVLFLMSGALVWFAMQGERQRYAMTAIALANGAVLAYPALTGRPRGQWRGWMVILPSVAGSVVGFALVGFLAGPGVAMTVTLVLAGLLLGARAMIALTVAAVIAVALIAYGMVSGVLPVPHPEDTSMTSVPSWVRSVGVTVLGTVLLGGLMVAVVNRIERSVRLAQDEAARRAQAERDRAEADLLALEAKQLETLGRLSAGVAHDFNNNLAAIMACAELLRHHIDSSLESREILDGVLQSARRAAELTRQLLVYARKARMLQTPTPLHPIVEEAVSFLRRSTDPKVQVVTELTAEAPIVVADSALLQSALLNLLVNGCDAMPNGGTLTVKTTIVADAELAAGRGRAVRLDVRDTGSGIDREILPHVFEPFFTTKAIGKGTGLGLAAVAGTVRAHGGRVEVTSEPAEGTAFAIYLPCADGDARDAVAQSAEVVRGSGEILLVEDDAMVSMTAVAALKSIGYDVTHATDGAAAVAFVRERPARFKLVLLDLRMPGMSGEATFDALRAVAPSLAVLLWSGYGEDQDIQGMLERGAVGFVSKPYRIAELSAAVASGIAAGERRAAGG